MGEEGFAAKTMIDPTSPIIGNQLYSHWLGVNWVALTGLTLFHAAFSIAVPLILVELLFPETRGRRLLGSPRAAVTLAVYGLTVFLLTFFLGDLYVPSLGVDVFLVAYASAFIAAAYLVPRSFLQAKGERPDRRERNFLLLGVGFMGGFFVISGNLAPGGGLVADVFSRGRLLPRARPVGRPHRLVPGEARGSIRERPREGRFLAGHCSGLRSD